MTKSVVWNVKYFLVSTICMLENESMNLQHATDNFM